MEIKKGNRYVCIKSTNGFTKGEVYTTNTVGKYIVNKFGSYSPIAHQNYEEYFIPYSQLDRVYTKHTPLLESIFNKYEGKKGQLDSRDIRWYCNCDARDITGYLWSDASGGDYSTEDYYQDNNYIYLSEKAFIEFMDLGRYIGSLNTESEEEVKESERILSQANDFKDITDSIAELLQYKNTKYGNSALEPLKIFSDKCKVGTRIDDKLARIKNSDSLKKNDVADLIGYCVLICKENGWNNFDEFKD